MNDSLTVQDTCAREVGKGMCEHGKVSGMFYATKRNASGFIRDARIVRNTVTNVGFAGMASRFNGAGSEAAFTYLALGTGATASAVGDTALETEITTSGLERANATASRVTTTQTNDTAQALHTWTASGSVSPTEVGLFNASSGGVLAARQVFTAIPLASSDSFQITYKVKFS